MIKTRGQWRESRLSRTADGRVTLPHRSFPQVLAGVTGQARHHTRLRLGKWKAPLLDHGMERHFGASFPQTRRRRKRWMHRSVAQLCLLFCCGHLHELPGMQR
jgi:hypothetical protein